MILLKHPWNSEIWGWSAHRPGQFGAQLNSIIVMQALIEFDDFALNYGDLSAH
jgi:hypothetical protein